METGNGESGPQEGRAAEVNSSSDARRSFSPLERGRARMIHTFLAGTLMGIANIIPGVSGGTMILAVGLYERFVDAVADLTRLRFRARSLIFLGTLGASAIVAIFVAATPISWGMEHHQHIMFASFIGLTLGGVPMIWKMMLPIKPASIIGAIGGFSAMIFLSFALRDFAVPVSFPFLFAGGIIGAAAMVLPGISGSYLLLALGLYYPIMDGIDEFKGAVRALDVAAAMSPALDVGLPLVLGVLTGIAGLANVLKALLRRLHDPTMGALLGLLLGSAFSLYPFREPGHNDPFAAAAPATFTSVLAVAACILIGFGITFAISRIEGREAKK